MIMESDYVAMKSAGGFRDNNIFEMYSDHIFRSSSMDTVVVIERQEKKNKKRSSIHFFYRRGFA